MTSQRLETSVLEGEAAMGIPQVVVVAGGIDSLPSVIVKPTGLLGV